jgi:hypothetical protein
MFTASLICVSLVGSSIALWLLYEVFFAPSKDGFPRELVAMDTRQAIGEDPPDIYWSDCFGESPCTVHATIQFCQGAISFGELVQGLPDQCKNMGSALREKYAWAEQHPQKLEGLTPVAFIQDLAAGALRRQGWTVRKNRYPDNPKARYSISTD